MTNPQSQVPSLRVHSFRSISSDLACPAAIAVDELPVTLAHRNLGRWSFSINDFAEGSRLLFRYLEHGKNLQLSLPVDNLYFQPGKPSRASHVQATVQRHRLIRMICSFHQLLQSS